jgi:predicted RND superfamily exporter protein
MRRRRNNKKIVLSKIIIVILCIFVIFFIVKFTLSRFKNDVNADVKLDAALYILDENYQSMTLKLDSIVPRNAPYEYIFYISNNDGTDRAEVNLEYTLSIVTTTNLPLKYELYLNGGTENIITEDTIERDEEDDDATYFRTLKTEKREFGFTNDESDTYKLLVYFPEEYKDIKYQDIIEGIEIQVNSKQIID